MIVKIILKVSVSIRASINASFLFYSRFTGRRKTKLLFNIGFQIQSWISQKSDGSDGKNPGFSTNPVTSQSLIFLSAQWV